MTTTVKPDNAPSSLSIPAETWVPISSWLTPALARDHRNPGRTLPLTQIQAIADQSRHLRPASRCPLNLTMPKDSWHTLANQLRTWSTNPETLLLIAKHPPTAALADLLNLIDNSDQPTP